MAKNLQEISRFLDKITKLDSHFFLSKAADRVYLCFETKKPTFTEFLDPARQNLIKTALSSLTEYGIGMAENGGYDDAERRMLGFWQKDADFAQFPIKRVSLKYDAKYGSPAHKDILGAVLGLGLDRSVIGDIVMLVDSAVIIADAKIADFLADNLFKVGKISVFARILDDDDVFFGLDNRLPDRITCASMRLDAVLAAAFSISRNETAAMIKSGKAFINWQEENSAAKAVKPGDMLTLRRYGRLRVVDIGGKSKKDRFVVEILRF